MEEANKTKLYIANIAKDVTLSTLTNYFSQFGEIGSVHLSKFPNGRSKGFAFLEYKQEQSAAAVLKGEHIMAKKVLYIEVFSQEMWTLNKRKIFVKRLNQDSGRIQIQDIKDYFIKSYGDEITENCLREGNEGQIHGWILFKDLECVQKILKNKFIQLNGNFFEISNKDFGKDTDLKGKGTVEKINTYNKKYQSRQFGFKLTGPAYENQFKRKIEKKKKPNFKNNYKYKERQEVESNEVGYYEGEFFPPEVLKSYIRNILKSNLNVGSIQKKKIKELELFYFNEKRRERIGTARKPVSYYTMVGRLIGKIEDNHFQENLRFFDQTRNLRSF